MLELTLGGRAISYRRALQTSRQIAVEFETHVADHLVVSGDLTAYATEAEFLSATSAFGALLWQRNRCSVVPGNHDCFTANSAQSRRFERHYESLLQSDLPEYQCEGEYPFVRLLGDDAAVIGLCSARFHPFPGVAWGCIGRGQLNALNALIASPRLLRRAILVLVHHAPLNQRGELDSRLHGLRDGLELLDLLPGPRFAVLHGHLHHRFHHPATATRPHIFCAGSSTQRGREGYWIIDVKDGRIDRFSMHVPHLRSAVKLPSLSKTGHHVDG